MSGGDGFIPENVCATKVAITRSGITRLTFYMIQYVVAPYQWHIQDLFQRREVLVYVLRGCLIPKIPHLYATVLHHGKLS